MSAKKTKPEIEAEILALKALKPTGPWQRKTAETICVTIDTLMDQVDETAEEFDELTDDQRDAYYSACRWRDGEPGEEKPSESFGGLVE